MPLPAPQLAAPVEGKDNLPLPTAPAVMDSAARRVSVLRSSDDEDSIMNDDDASISPRSASPTKSEANEMKDEEEDKARLLLRDYVANGGTEALGTALILNQQSSLTEDEEMGTKDGTGAVDIELPAMENTEPRQVGRRNSTNVVSRDETQLQKRPRAQPI